jgi:hypothetical protein
MESRLGFDEVCPLCQSFAVTLFLRGSYWRCEKCDLVFLSTTQRPLPAEEWAHYQLHRNSLEDHDYCEFLQRLARPLSAHLKPGARGVDMGSGPVPVLAHLLRECGFACAVYDPFFAPDMRIFECRYDFVSASEVIEHLHQPAQTLSTWWQLLEPGGWLAVMTNMQRPGAEAFADWYYRRDPTHVCFWSVATFTWLAHRWQAEVEFPHPHLALLQKPFLS